MRWILLVVASLFFGISAAESLSVSFTTTSAGGNYAPTHVLAVWVETSSGTFVKTLGDWSNRRRTSLTQWRAKAGTSDTDAVMGATNGSHARRTVTWDMSAKAAPGTPVANGVYKIWFETVDVNTPGAGTNSIYGANRFSFAFTKDGVAKPVTTVTDASGKYTNITYTYTGVTAGATYGVVYSGNGNTGGAVPTDATAYTTGQTVTVKANSGNLVRTGHVFGGWNTLANGTGTNYTAGSGTFAMGSANVTLYATWTPSFTVTYQGNGSTSGSVPTDATTYLAGQTVTVKTNSGNLAKTGSVFAGWNTAADGSGTSYTAGTGTFAMGAANIILYARWTVVSTASVIYDGNGSTSGSVPVDSATYSAGQTVTVKANTGVLAKTGFTFAGWNTAANGTGTDYASTGSATLVMGAVDLRLFAKWTALPTFTVTYHGNGSTGGSVPTDATAYYAGQTVTVLANSGNLVKTGYVFGGWNSLADGTGTTYVAGSGTLVMGSTNVTLYAKWTPTFTVTYQGNGSTSGSECSDGHGVLCRRSDRHRESKLGELGEDRIHLRGLEYGREWFRNVLRRWHRYLRDGCRQRDTLCSMERSWYRERNL